MAKFVSNYPEYRKTHGNVTKHVALVCEMSRIVEERKLMLVSQTEQELACTNGQAAAFEVSILMHVNYTLPSVTTLNLPMICYVHFLALDIVIKI